jgi:DMSO/TMAO reductase YedYZ molybdopterin-dependent catalytic subunit
MLDSLPRAEMAAPLVCQIFNWYEEVSWEGIRLADFLDAISLPVSEDGYYAFYSRDGQYFETLSYDEAHDPRVLLATHLDGKPLPHRFGGPVRLVVPFLQGYKSVKWVGAIHGYRHDPVGIKRLLGQSKSGRLGQAWLDRLGIEPAAGRPGDPMP